ncbi:ABC transporter permease [Longimicrobium sp.]|uniref:ABC transporter permease n=1 Tax=Longimicrobium sp. TaxID=2029185 RepID=UPI002ED7DF8B
MRASLLAEWRKVRRLHLALVSVACGVAFSALVWMSVRGALVRLANERRVEMRWQDGVIGDTTVLVSLAFPTLVIMITAMVFFVEHRTDMWKQLRALPRPISSVYAAKFLVVQLFVALAVAAALAAGLVGWELMPADAHTVWPVADATVRATLSRLALLTYLALVPASLVQFAVSARFRNVLVPVGVGLLATFACLLMMGPGRNQWLPYAYPGGVVMAEFAAPRAGGGDHVTDARYRPPAGAFGEVATRPTTILVDEAHGNRHGLGNAAEPGTLRWIVQPAEEARIQVYGLYVAVRPQALADVQLLVVAGATTDLDGKGAFSDAEIRTVQEWVRAGGSLLLLTDHEPFAGRVRRLAEAFGVRSSLDVLADPAHGDPRAPNKVRTVFGAGGVPLGAHPVTTGVGRVITYGGQALARPDPGTTVLLPLAPSARLLTGRPLFPGVPRERQGQLLAFPYGRGRVVVSGETALFTAQRKRSDGTIFGVGDAGTDNARLALNVFSWLLDRPTAGASAT